jgi:hypothetical protein
VRDRLLFAAGLWIGHPISALIPKQPISWFLLKAFNKAFKTPWLATLVKLEGLQYSLINYSSETKTGLAS